MTNPQDPAEVARRQARLEQQMLEARLEILQSHRKQRESTQSRRLNFFLVFALSAAVAWIVDRKGYPPQIVIGSAVVTIVVFGGWWAFRKPY
jgi:Flp pilus assembly protein TadB